MTASFEVATQAGRTINNVGGDQHVHVSQARMRLARIGKTIAFAGLCLVLTGLVLIGFAGYATVNDVRAAIDEGSFAAPYLDYAPGYWPIGVGSFFGGIVLGKLGRVLSL